MFSVCLAEIAEYAFDFSEDLDILDDDRAHGVVLRLQSDVAALVIDCLLYTSYLCRNILVKTESDYDKFDMAFAEYFQGIQTVDEIREELCNWLSADELERELDDMPAWAREYDFDELMEMFRQRLAEQDEKHDGGNYWIGTGAVSYTHLDVYKRQDFDIYDKDQETLAELSCKKLQGPAQIRDYRYILDFTNEGGWLKDAYLADAILYASPGVPYSMDQAAEARFEDKAVHDNLEIGTAIMLGEALQI